MTTSNEFEMPGPDDLTPIPNAEPREAPVLEPIDSPVAPAPPDAPRPAEPPSATSTSSPAPAILASVLGLAAAVVVGSAWYFGYWPFESKTNPAADHATPVASADQTTPPASTDSPAIPPSSAIQADEDRVSRDEFDALSKRLDKLQDRLDKSSQETESDIQPLESRINVLETLPDTVKTLSSKVQKIDDRLVKAETTIEGFDSRIAAIEALADQPEKPTETVSPGDNLQSGIRLFDDGRYREAREVFDELTQKLAPDDARAWYFDALATGLSTGDWKEAATRLAEQGVKREQAGTPPRDEIDQALEDLTEPTGRDWIASFRKRVKK